MIGLNDSHIRTIYVLHEFGSPSHLNALCYLAKKKHVNVHFCEFNLIEQLKRKPLPTRRFFYNLFVLLFLIFAPTKKIIIGIAPVNHALKLLLNLYGRHELYYHTSYTFWDFKTLVHKPKNDDDIATWTHFINYAVKRIFAVSEKTKKELCANFQICPSKISIVNHAYQQKIQISSSIPERNTYICVGELSYRKGVNELLDIFSTHPELSLTLIGKGDLQKKVEDFSQRFENIHYKGYISNWNDLEINYKENLFLILNSHRTSQWEELFGMVLIEGMACGCIPLATNHSGPQEIITDCLNGFLYEEGEIEKVIEKTKKMEQEDVISMRECAVKRGMQYSVQNISLLWEPIFK